MVMMMLSEQVYLNNIRELSAIVARISANWLYFESEFIAGFEPVSDGQILIRDLDIAAGRIGDAVARELLVGPQPVTAMRFNPNGALLAAISGNRLTVWDAASGELLVSTTDKKPMTHLAFSPAGETVATASADGVIREFPVLLDDWIKLARSLLPE